MSTLSCVSVTPCVTRSTPLLSGFHETSQSVCRSSHGTTDARPVPFRFLIDGQLVPVFTGSRAKFFVTGVSAQIPPNCGTKLRGRETPPKAVRATAAAERDKLLHQVHGMGLVPGLFQPQPRAVLHPQQQVHRALQLGI